MMNRAGAVLLAPARAAALVLLSVVGTALAVASLQLLVVVVTAPLIAVVVRRYATIGRWVAGRWGGVPVPAPAFFLLHAASARAAMLHARRMRTFIQLLRITGMGSSSSLEIDGGPLVAAI